MSNVMSWLLSHLITGVLLLSFLAILSYALWLRFKMRVSKARFALAVVATMASCAAGLLAFLSGPAPIQILNAILSTARALTGISSIPVIADETNWLTTLLGSLATALTLYLIYRFSVTALKHWEGPVTVTVNELAKRERDNSISLLAFAEIQRLLASKTDPLASEVAVNWQQRHSDAPGAPAWHIMARQLFESAFSEVLFAGTGWRDRFQIWVGEIYLSQPRASDTVPLALFVFDDEPDDSKIAERIDAFLADGASLVEVKIFAIFDHGASVEVRSARIRNLDVEIWPRQALLRKGLKFTIYARDLVKRFDKDVLGGTAATLADTFVKAHVKRHGTREREPMDRILAGWINEKSRRQLAITGEYGQGKSTAMLDFCVNWAKRYLDDPAIPERVPLLIELRGQNPAESDPVAFLSGWSSRYGLPPMQLYNLIRTGEAILIFEGFDELRNAGRAYDRHEHFNALWRFAYPGTKVIFTGRPNFFLDEKEKNRTLRNDPLSGAAGNAFTQLWEIDRLTEDEVRRVVTGFGEAVGASIMTAATAHPAFLEIVSRPSMLPVVATIWDKIVALQKQGHNLTSAALLELYLQAIYRRKEEEIESDRRIHGTPEGASYLVLPREVREFLTLAIVWKMADTDARNTISRSAFDGVISQIFDDVFRIFQSEGVPHDITQRVRAFEERFKEETKGDRLERISNEIASSGLFVPDPAGGPSNLRLPHKQFYEYLIAKAAWMVLAHREKMTSKSFQSAVRNKNAFQKLVSEDLSLQFLSEIIGSDLGVFRSVRLYVYISLSVAQIRVRDIGNRLWRLIRKTRRGRYDRIYTEEGEELDVGSFQLTKLSFVAAGAATSLSVSEFFQSKGSDEISKIAIAAMTMLIIIGALVVPVSGWLSFSSFTAFRKILYSRLEPIFHSSGRRLTVLAFYEECLWALSNSSKSSVVRKQSELSAIGQSQEAAQREFQQSISPLA